MRPTKLDVLLAFALFAWGALEAILLNGAGSTAERLAWAVVFSVPVLWRRRAPVVVPIALAAAVILRVLIAQGDAAEEGAMPFPSLLLVLFTTAAYARTLQLSIVAGLVVYAALATVIALSYF